MSTLHSVPFVNLSSQSGYVDTNFEEEKKREQPTGSSLRDQELSQNKESKENTYFILGSTSASVQFIFFLLRLLIVHRFSWLKPIQSETT
jgi:hypothetical protein